MGSVRDKLLPDLCGGLLRDNTNLTAENIALTIIRITSAVTASPRTPHLMCIPEIPETIPVATIVPTTTTEIPRANSFIVFLSMS